MMSPYVLRDMAVLSEQTVAQRTFPRKIRADRLTLLRLCGDSSPHQMIVFQIDTETLHHQSNFQRGTDHVSNNFEVEHKDPNVTVI